MPKAFDLGARDGDVFADLPHHREKNHRYSIRRALLAGEADTEPTGLEGEVSAEIAVRTGRRARGIWIPHDAPTAGRRNLTLGGTGAGAYQTTVASTWWDVLRPKLVLNRLGARISDFGGGVGGNVAIPVKQQASVPTWVTEGQAPPESNESIAQSLVTPHTVTNYTDCTRRMLSLGAPGFMQFLEDDLIGSVAVAIDAAGLNGSGNSNEPLGLFQMPGIPTVVFSADSGNGGAPDYPTLCQMESIIGQACADSPETARLGWVTTPQGRSKLRRTPSLGSTYTGLPCWECRDGRESMLGWPAASTTNAPGGITKESGTALSALLFGNFNDLVVQLFPAVDIIVNPYLQSLNGVVRLTIYQDADIMPLRAISFVAAPAMVTT